MSSASDVYDARIDKVLNDRPRFNHILAMID